MKKHWKFRLLSILAALALCAGLTPAALADGGASLIMFRDNTAVMLEPDTPRSGEGWSWAGKTLTINGLNAKSISFGDASELVINGTNTLDSLSLYCSYGNDSFTVSGEGELILDNTASGEPALHCGMDTGYAAELVWKRMRITDRDNNALTMTPDGQTGTIRDEYASDDSGKASYVRISPIPPTESGITWEIQGDTLILSGTGPTEDYGGDYHSPFSSGLLPGVTKIEVGEGITRLGDYIFRNLSRITSVTLPSTLVEIGESSFGWCEKLTDIHLPDSLTGIGVCAFEESGLTALTIPEGVSEIGTAAFIGCRNLRRVTLPNSLTTLGSHAFERTALVNATIPENLKRLEEQTFYGCSGLKTVSVPAGTVSISNIAFLNCGALTDVYYGGGETDWEHIWANDYTGVDYDFTVHYNSYPFVPAPSAVLLPSPSGGSTVRYLGETALPAGAKAFAVRLDGGRMAEVAPGTVSGEDGLISFEARLTPGQKLFFLAPDTFIPLARPAVLE